MRYILPRVILGNRGDIASRWSLLQTLREIGAEDVYIYSRTSADLPADIPYQIFPYSPARNFPVFLPKVRESFPRNATILWSVGLDIQDDSSLAKLIYLLSLFRTYKYYGLNICCLFQGAGPIVTRIGKLLTKQLLNCVDVFVARDPGTYSLITGLSNHTKTMLGYDAIFLPGLDSKHIINQNQVTSRPVIGINIRQWFHFNAGILPYQYAKNLYRKRSLKKMDELIESVTALINDMVDRYDARIVLLSAYQPGVVPWEDDMPWLKEVVQKCSSKENISLIQDDISMPEYFSIIKGLDVMIGMRLHSSLTALRFGVPSINISYTLKGKEIFRHLGLSDFVFEIPDVMYSPHSILNSLDEILSNPIEQRKNVQAKVQYAVQYNEQLLRSIIFCH